MSSASCSPHSVRATCSFSWAACGDCWSLSHFAVAESTAFCHFEPLLRGLDLLQQRLSAIALLLRLLELGAQENDVGCDIFDSRSMSIFSISAIVGVRPECSLSEGDEESAFAAGASEDFADLFLCNSANCS